MDTPMKGQILIFEGNAFKYNGGDPSKDDSYEHVPYGTKTIGQSMSEELATRGPMTRLWAGGAGAMDKAAFGLKGAITDLAPQEQERVDAAKGTSDTVAGKIGAIGTDIALKTPAYMLGGAALGLPKIAALGPLARDALSILTAGGTGAGLGAITNPGERTRGAITEGLGASLGSAMGTMARGPFAPVGGSTADALQQQGARLTPGQTSGGMTKSIEDATRTINPQIAKRQQEGIGDFNRILTNEKLVEGRVPGGPVSGAGHKMIEDAQRKFGAEYDRLGTPIMRADAPFIQSVDDLVTASKPYLTFEEQGTLRGLTRIAKQMAAGQKNTSAFRSFENNLASDAKKAGPNLAEALKLLQGHMEGLRGRAGQATPQLDKSYAEFSRMKEAAASQGAMDTGLFSPGMLRGAVKTKSTVQQRATGRALLQQDIAEAEKVLGDTIPKVGPGTAEKGFWLSSIPAAAVTSYATGQPWILGGLLGALGANKLAYTRSGVNMLTGNNPIQQAITPEWQAALAAATASGANQATQKRRR